MQMLRSILTACLLLPAIASAQATRAPEPVPSASAQMFAQLDGKGASWIKQAEALDYLSRYDVPGAASSVKAVLNDEQPNNQWIRGRALVALARIEPSSAASLAKAYAQDPQAALRVAAAEICAQLNKSDAEPLIADLLKDTTPAVQFAALAANARHHGADAWELTNTITAKTPGNCVEPAVMALGWIGTAPAHARLIEIAGQGSTLSTVFRGLKMVNNPANVSLYLDLLSLTQDSALIADAWGAMRRFDRALVIADCRAALATGDENRIQTVSRIMAHHLKEPELGEALQTALAESTERDTLRLGLSALSCIEADRFSDLYLANLKHEDAAIRLTAVRSLAQCRRVNLYQVLEQATGDSDKAVRVAALDSLQRASIQDVPRDRVIEYFTPSLLAPDPATRKAAITALSPSITQDNGKAALAAMKQMQGRYGKDGSEPLMRAVFRMVTGDESAQILEAHGYVARWHVIGAFPAGFGAPAEDIDGLVTSYPPEQQIDLSQKFAVKYNTKSDTRFGKAVGEDTIGWVAATVGNADGVLYMTKAGRSQLQMPRRNGVCYAYTTITLPEKTDVRLAFIFNMKAQDRVWINGEVLNFEAKIDKDQGLANKTTLTTLDAGTHRILVKVVSNDYSQAHWAPKVSLRGFALILSDPQGKPIQWSHE